MPLFRRNRDERPGDLAQLLLEGHDMIEQTGQAHAQHWGLGSAQRWDLDQTAGLLRFTFPDRVAEAPVQVLGTYSPTGGSWTWAWANDSLDQRLRTASDEVRAYGAANGATALTTPSLDVSEEQAADLAAIAFRLSRASGFYRAPAGQLRLYLAFAAVTLIDADGNRKNFTIEVG